MTSDEVLEGLVRERARLLAAVDALGEEASTLAVTEPGGWSAKDVLAHLSHYAGQLAFGLGAPVSPPPYVVGVSERLSAEEWNRRSVEHWRPFTLGEVRAELVAVTDHIIERVRERTDADMADTGAIPWAGTRPLWEIIGSDTFLHEWPAHAAQIEAAVDR